jgi:hypothetical protein
MLGVPSRAFARRQQQHETIQSGSKFCRNRRGLKKALIDGAPIGNRVGGTTTLECWWHLNGLSGKTPMKETSDLVEAKSQISGFRAFLPGTGRSPNCQATDLSKDCSTQSYQSCCFQSFPKREIVKARWKYASPIGSVLKRVVASKCLHTSTI